MTESGGKNCRTCGETIPSAAAKCRHCGSYQNWQRFLDFGQGTTALLIALISVTTLAVESGSRAFNKLFVNPFAAHVSAKVLRLSIDEVELLFSNNGGTRVLISEGALCRVPLVRKGANVVGTEGEFIRYPRREEIDGIYAVSYSSAEERFLEAGSSSRIKVGRTSLFREQGLPIREEVADVKGYCFIQWIGQDGAEDGAFLSISALDTHYASEGLAKLPYGETVDAKVEGKEGITTPLQEWLETTR